MIPYNQQHARSPKHLESKFLSSIEYPTYFPSIEDYFFPDSNGICLNGTHHLTEKESFEHVLLCAKTGVGKSTKFIIPSCCRVEGSQVIHDPSGELYDILKDDLNSRGYQIWRLNFSNPTKSLRWNPLEHIQCDEDVYLLSELLVRSENRNKNSNADHWLDKATALVTAFIHLVLRLRPKDRTLGTVYRLLQKATLNANEIEKLFKKRNVPEAYQLTFKAMMANKTAELSGIMSTSSRALFQFSEENEKVHTVTSKNNVNLHDLRAQKTALFIQNSPNRSHLYHKPISILFEQLWSITMEDIPSPWQQPVYFIIDEAASLFFPSLPFKIDKARKYRISIMLAYQTLGQVQHSYDEELHHVILDNCVTKIFAGPHEDKTAVLLEEAIGRYKAPYTEMLYPRKTREEIRTWGKDTTLILRSGLIPILTKNIPYYENETLDHLPR